MSNDKPSYKYWIIALILLVVLSITTTIADIYDNAVLLFPSLPGYLVYVLVTGDIHGWQPGPIGQVGRIAVVTLGSWIFWTPLINWFYKERRRKRFPK